ncbi:MAG: hypothetical protein HY754_07575 [Nitrospirae bacterium]|nr:hypothetical protein [Nitrospirota bacterium]
MKTHVTPIIVVGLTSILMQITALRQLMSVFSGNELDIGITLSVWLSAVGIGSYAGHRFKIKHAFGISFLLIAFLVQPTVIFSDLIRLIFSLEHGETIPLTTVIISTIIAITPICFILGFQFPLAVSHLKGDSSKAYGLEAIGAFIGGTLFTLVLSGRVNPFVLLLTVSLINALIALSLLRKKFLIVLFLIPLLLYLGTDRINRSIQWKGFTLVKRVESKYGEIRVLNEKGQANVYGAGKFQFSYPDPQAEELKAHLPMSLHPSAGSILLVGGSPAVLREFLKYPIAGIDFVEIDAEMINVSLDILNKKDRDYLDDKRLKIITVDARRFIKTLNRPHYDLIVFNLPEPSTANINRFYTVEFFREVRSALKQDGELLLSLPTAFGYVGKRMQTANGSIYNSLKKVFRHVELSSGEYGILIASDTFINTDPGLLEDRFSKKGIETKYFHPYILRDAFSPLKVNMVKERLGKVKAVNEDRRPVAYLYNLMLWAEIQKGNALMFILDYGNPLVTFAAVLFFIGAVVSWRKKVSLYYSIFTTGYSAMAFSMIIILCYQTVFGYIYEVIGLITAVFMIGVAAGAYIGKGIKRPLRGFKLFEILTILLLVSSPVFFTREILFYTLSFLTGVIAGAEFAAANQLMKEGVSARVAGQLYAFDLAGSFLGALLTAIFFVPLFGIQNTILFVVLIKIMSLSLLFLIRNGG